MDQVGRLKKGDLVIEKLSEIFKDKSGAIIAIGALKWAKLALYDLSNKKYHETKINGPLELANLTGFVAQRPDGGTGIHAHVTLCDKHFTSHSGHLVEGEVAATVEYKFSKSAKKLKRYFDKDIGLNLFRL